MLRVYSIDEQRYKNKNITPDNIIRWHWYIRKLSVCRTPHEWASYNHCYIQTIYLSTHTRWSDEVPRMQGSRSQTDYSAWQAHTVPSTPCYMHMQTDSYTCLLIRRLTHTQTHSHWAQQYTVQNWCREIQLRLTDTARDWHCTEQTDRGITRILKHYYKQDWLHEHALTNNTQAKTPDWTGRTASSASWPNLALSSTVRLRLSITGRSQLWWAHAIRQLFHSTARQRLHGRTCRFSTRCIYIIHRTRPLSSPLRQPLFIDTDRTRPRAQHDFSLTTGRTRLLIDYRQIATTRRPRQNTTPGWHRQNTTHDHWEIGRQVGHRGTIHRVIASIPPESKL